MDTTCTLNFESSKWNVLITNQIHCKATQNAATNSSRFNSIWFNGNLENSPAVQPVTARLDSSQA